MQTYMHIMQMYMYKCMRMYMYMYMYIVMFYVWMHGMEWNGMECNEM